MSDYSASIITSIHNSDLNLFRETIRSVKDQTIGFGNIEWIIVLHNCDREYSMELSRLLDMYENIILKPFIDETKSAFSARNYGLKFVTSPYVAYLGAEDRLNPEMMEKCVSQMGKLHADMVQFRISYHQQMKSMQSTISDITLWNPMEEIIVLTGDELRSEELFSSISYGIYNRLYDVEFLKTNKLRFENTLVIGQDAYFVLNCYAKAEKIVVLPQFIGYHYLIIEDPTMKGVNKSSAEVLGFADSFKAMFDLLLDIKAYYNYFFLIVLEAYVNYAYCSYDFTMEDWEQLQREMSPYAKMVTQPPVNKFYTKEEGRLIYEFVTSNLLYSHENLENDYYNGEIILKKTIRENLDTSFGQYYNFESIRSLEEFRDTVPIYEHKDYDKLIRLQLDAGERNLLSKKPLKQYAYDFNESSEMRMVPVAGEVYKQMGHNFIDVISGQTTFLMMEAMPRGMKFNNEACYDSVMGLMLRSGLEDISFKKAAINGLLTTPVALLFPSEEVNCDYLNLLMALRNENLTQIYASNTWVVWNYIEMLLKHGKQLCKDIAFGRISIEKEDKAIYKEIEAKNTANPERAGQILEALQNKNKEKMLKKIWPNLECIIARKGGDFAFFTKKLERFNLGVELKPDNLISPFGIVAYRTDEKDVYSLNTRNGFYEFLPVSTDEDTEALLLSEVKTGKVYEIVITNENGVYRMRSNIFIRPVRQEKGQLWFEECMRPIFDDSRLPIDGNDLEEMLENCVGDNLYDYFCYFNQEKTCLEICMELNQERDVSDYEEMVEEWLLKNEKYSAARDHGLNHCSIIVIEKESRLLWRDIRREKYHAPADCFQPVHSVKNIELIPMLKGWQMRAE